MYTGSAGGSGATTSKTNISLDDAIILATELIKPLTDVNKHIQDNISMIKEKKDEIATIDANRTDLTNIFKTRTADLITTSLSYPQTVCGAVKCIGSTKLANGENVVEYKQICHEHCRIRGVPTGCQRQDQLQKCDAMSGPSNDRKCAKCSCPWQEHMHLTYKTTKVEKEVEDSNIKEFLITSNNKLAAVKVFSDTLQGNIKILEDEQNAVTQVSAQLTTFLEQNNKSTGIDVTAGYLDHLIDVQQTLVTLGNSPQLLESMMTTRTSYNQEVDALKKATKTGTIDQVLITPDNILESVQKLCTLPKTGDQIRSTISAVSSTGIMKLPTTVTKTQ